MAPVACRARATLALSGLLLTLLVSCGAADATADHAADIPITANSSMPQPSPSAEPSPGTPNPCPPIALCAPGTSMKSESPGSPKPAVSTAPTPNPCGKGQICDPGVGDKTNPLDGIWKKSPAPVLLPASPSTDVSPTTGSTPGPCPQGLCGPGTGLVLPGANKKVRKPIRLPPKEDGADH